MPARFVDASVFVHAYLRPRRDLKSHERQIRARARSIVTRINAGEETLTSTVHLGELANVLEDWMPLDDARAVLRGLCSRRSIEILPSDRRDLIEALTVGSESGVGMTDALAVVLMWDRGASEVYSFDKDFDRFEGIRRISQ